MPPAEDPGADAAALRDDLRLVPAAAAADSELDAGFELWVERSQLEWDGKSATWTFVPRRGPQVFDLWEGEAIDRVVWPEDPPDPPQEDPAPLPRSHQLQVLALLSRELGAAGVADPAA